MNYPLFAVVLILAIALIAAYFYIRQRRRMEGAFRTDNDIDTQHSDVGGRSVGDTRYSDASTPTATAETSESARRP